MQPSLTRVFVNGSPLEIPTESSLVDLLRLLQRNEASVATAVNEIFVPRTQRSAVRLQEGDAIMTFEPITGG